MIVLIQCQFPSSDNCSKVTYNLYHWESWVKIIQALSELFLQLFKNKKGSNEHTHTHTHTHKDTPMIKNVWILRLAPKENRDQGDASNRSKNAKDCQQITECGWEAWDRFSLTALRRKQLCWHLDLGLLVSRMVRQ